MRAMSLRASFALFFIVAPVTFVINGAPWYYAFIPDPEIYEMGAFGCAPVLMCTLDWICVIAAILLADP